MKMNSLILIYIHISMVKGAFYSAKSNENLCYKDEIGKTESPSLISCTLYCRRVNGESIALFEKGECRCVLKSDNEMENKEEGMMTFMQPFHLKQSAKTWRHIDIVGPKELEIKLGNLITTIPTMTKQYIFSIDFKKTKAPAFWDNVLHMTTGLNKGIYGSRTPGIWTNGDEMAIHSAVNSLEAGNGYGYVTKLSSGINKWETIKISQLKDSTDVYRFNVEINGKLLHSVINNNPAAFVNVKCYISNPWRSSQNGYVKNVWHRIYGLWL